MSEATPLAAEMATYRKNLPDWKEQEGRFVVIQGAVVAGFFDGYEEALTAGYERFGVSRFLVKEVLQQEKVHVITRLIAPATAIVATVALLAAPAGAQETWLGIEVAPEHRCSPYDPADYEYPQSVELRIIDELGGIYGPYSDRWFESRYETDIEHMVARSEAHDSGLCAADRATRRQFASDTLNLTLAAPRLNRYEKRAGDAAEWLPEHNRCWFAERVVAVRLKYGLTIDRAEAAALDAVLAECARR